MWTMLLNLAEHNSHSSDIIALGGVAEAGG